MVNRWGKQSDEMAYHGMPFHRERKADEPNIEDACSVFDLFNRMLA
jgi:hypothetical protein